MSSRRRRRRRRRRRPEIDARRFAPIGQGARQEIAAGHVPGAVILVGHRGKTVYRKAFGQCALMPLCRPMKVDTIFDLASLTKVVATTTAVMILVDRGLIHLDKPAAAYWPAFAANGKGGITIRQLMTHTSGLRAGVASRPPWSDYDGAMEAIAHGSSGQDSGDAVQLQRRQFHYPGRDRATGSPICR